MLLTLVPHFYLRKVCIMLDSHADPFFLHKVMSIICLTVLTLSYKTYLRFI